MSIKFRVLAGGLGGAGKCRFYFYGREDFSDSRTIIIGTVPRLTSTSSGKKSVSQCGKCFMYVFYKVPRSFGERQIAL